MVSDGEAQVAVVADFDPFYAQTGRRMVTLAYSMTGNWGDAEDLVQEAYAAAHRNWNVVGGCDDPAAWVRRVIANRAVSRWRRIGREVNVRQRLAARTRESTVDADPGDAAFWPAVQALPAQQRRVVSMRYVEGLSVESIATALGALPLSWNATSRSRSRNGPPRHHRLLVTLGAFWRQVALDTGVCG